MCAALQCDTEYVFTSFKIKYSFTFLYLSLYFSPKIIWMTKSRIIIKNNLIGM